LFGVDALKISVETKVKSKGFWEKLSQSFCDFGSLEDPTPAWAKYPPPIVQVGGGKDEGHSNPPTSAMEAFIRWTPIPTWCGSMFKKNNCESDDTGCRERRDECSAACKEHDASTPCQQCCWYGKSCVAADVVPLEIKEWLTDNKPQGLAAALEVPELDGTYIRPLLSANQHTGGYRG